MMRHGKLGTPGEVARGVRYERPTGGKGKGGGGESIRAIASWSDTPKPKKPSLPGALSFTPYENLEGALSPPKDDDE
jgi:hypothetical protein